MTAFPIRPPARALCALVAVCPLLALSAGAARADDDVWLKALTDSFVVEAMTTGDLDGDGKEDTALCYRESVDRTDAHGGVAVLSRRDGGLVPVFHVRLANTHCDKIGIKGRRLGMMIKGDRVNKGDRKLIWTYGEDIVFVGDETHPLTGTTAEASSTMRGRDIRPTSVLDRDLSTSWAEGMDGTGIGEKLTLTFPEPIDVGWVGVYAGSGGSPATFYLSNRVHRGSLKVRGLADLGDATSGLDFADLGLDVGGDSISFSCDDRPGLTYVRVDKRDVKQIEIRIDSVYLGKRLDDTHIAEVEIVPSLRKTATVDRSLRVKVRPESGGDGAGGAKAAGGKGAKGEGDDEEEEIVPDARAEAALEALDEGGRGIPIDDDL